MSEYEGRGNGREGGEKEIRSGLENHEQRDDREFTCFLALLLADIGVISGD
jgi:hypothetical protein